MRFIVVEDELYVAELIQHMLEDLGNTCFLANSVDDAERLLDENSIEAATLDLGMPGRSGLEWLESLATKRPDLARRTLVITGQHLEPESVNRVVRCGAGVLAKPFTLLGLQDALRTQIERPAERGVR